MLDAVFAREFEEATMPSPYDLAGRWCVSVLTGLLPNMRHLGHIKMIERGPVLTGYNKTLLWKWGKFHIYFATDYAMFKYDKYTFVDKVRMCSNGSLIGQYRVTLGKPQFGGYFRMIKQ